MDDGLDSIWIALAQLKLERANLLAERCRLLQERGGGLVDVIRISEDMRTGVSTAGNDDPRKLTQ